MRLNTFRQLSVAEQKREVKKAKEEIILAFEKLNKIGTWNKSEIKSILEDEIIIWQANKSQ